MKRHSTDLTSPTDVQLIYAGGTFGSYGQPLAPLDTDIFLPVLQSLLTDDLPRFSWLDNPLIKDSSQLHALDFTHFYTLILNAYATGQRQFVLITGTDTLSYLGAFLAEAFAGSDICIVLTASMRPLLDSTIIHDYQKDDDSDAWDNFTAALRLAAYAESGVQICFGGEAWPAQTVQKIHSHDLMAFTGHTRAAYPASSYVKDLPTARRQHWLDDRLAALADMTTRAANACVQAIYCLPNDADVLRQQLDHLADKPPCGIIILGFGAGNIPKSEALAAALEQAYAQGHMVVCASQCAFGGVSASYAAGSWQYAHHVIAGERLTIPAIYARLLWLHVHFDTPARRRQRWRYTVTQGSSEKR